MKILLLVTLLVVGIAGNPKLDPLVFTDVGLYKGLRADDGDYSMFLGIPYASIDRDKPFGSSFPHPAMEEPFEAYDGSIVCPHIDRSTGQPIGDIDCLRLHVYVPDSANSQNKLPVLVWIHGGSFNHGSGRKESYGPKYLIKHDVIIVSINYRVGPYGFSCLDLPEVSSNAGLKDQKLALRWVKQNIENFGGDPDSITISGQSAGSMSIDYHLHYSADENLFHKAIMQSGTSQVYAGTFQENGARFSITFAKELGFDTDDPRAAIEFLSTIDSHSVIEAFAKHDGSRPEMLPCDESDFENPDKFINEKFMDIVPKIQNVPILIGFNNAESLSNYVNLTAEDYKNVNIVKEYLLSIWNFDEVELEEQSKKITRFYWSDEDLSESIKQQLINFDSDLLYAYPVERDIQKYFKQGAKALYHYVFSYSGSRNYAPEGGANHGDEFRYLFSVVGLPEPTQEDQLVIDRMTTMWTNFVKYGDPTPETTDLLPLKWEPLTEKKLNYLQIDSELSLGQRPVHDRFAFLDVFWELNKKKHKTYNGSEL